MSSFNRLIRFQGVVDKDQNIYFSDLGPDASGIPVPGDIITAYASFAELASKRNAKEVVVWRVRSPFISITCLICLLHIYRLPEIMLK